VQRFKSGNGRAKWETAILAGTARGAKGRICPETLLLAAESGKNGSLLQNLAREQQFA
jgi:hypothetical protein